MIGINVMGMYDDFNISDDCKLLPDGITDSSWQTKDLDCTLEKYELLADGSLVKCHPDNIWKDKPNKYFFTKVGTGYIELFDGRTTLAVHITNGVADKIEIGDVPWGEGGLTPDPAWEAPLETTLE